MQVSKEESILIANEFIGNELKEEKWFQDIEKYIKAIIFYGSRAKRTNREDSDIDLLVILPLEIEKKYTKGEYAFDFKGLEVNIVMRSIEKLRIIDFAKDEFQKEVFRDCEILYEGDNEVKELTSIFQTK